MATLTHAESKRLYSWWWSSHISPKNSKWLQENLTDVDGNVKAMIKLIEEDADSFARRAEMYYKKRPELMKMVEEFYRAYRALAERYDNAMGELRQAHRTMADAFSNQMPFLIPEESLSSSSQSEPQTPITPHPIGSLLDSDDHPKNNSGSSPQSHMIKRAGVYSDDGELYSVRKGLKQFKNIFSEKSIGSETSSLTEEKSSSDFQEAVLKEEVKKLQNELLKLSSENQNLASRILLVTERSDEVETEVQSLRDSLSTLETEKVSAMHLCEQSLKKVSNFEAENFQERTFTSMLSSFEDRCCFLEASNQSLQSKIEALLHKTVLQEKEICEKKEELDKLYSSQEEALHSLERVRGESEEEKRILGLELGVTNEKLEEVESIKSDLEQQLQKTKEDNFRLHKHYLSSNLMIKNLQDEIMNLKEAKSGLEDEVTELISKESALQQQLSYLKNDMEDLGWRHQFVIDQIESVGFNAETFHLSIKELQDENSELKSVFIKEKNDNINFLNKLGEMEKVSAKSSLLESSLTDATNELEVLREKLEDQADSFRSLQKEKADLLSQKNTLISRVNHSAEDLEKISLKNSTLENSLLDLTIELDGFRVKSICLEESIQFLQNENSSLLAERDNLTTHVETIQSCLKDLERNLCQMEEKNSFLNEEKELAVQRISELELLLAQKKEEHSLFAESNCSIMANLKYLVGVLQEEVSSRNNELEEEEEKHLAAHTEVLVLQICIIDLKQQNDGLFRELHMHNKGLLNVKNHVSTLQDEVLELKKEVKQMEEIKLKQRLAMNQVSRSLDIETFDKLDDDIEGQLSGKIERLKCSLLNSEDEIELLLFERSIDNLVLKEMRHEGLNMISEKERSDHNLVIRMEEISFCRTETEKLLEEEKLLKNKIEICLHQEEMLMTERENLSSQLSEACKAQLTLSNENYELLEENQSWKKEFCFLRDEKYILEEEYTTLFKEALSHHYLYLIFENFSSEKATELRELNCEVEKLTKVCCDFKEVTEMTGDRMKELELDNVLLKENVVKLEGYKCQFLGLENEILEIRSYIEELNGKIVEGKQLLSRKEIDLSNTLMIIEAKDRENIKLRDDARALEGDCCEEKILIESLKGSLNLAEDKARHDEKQYMELVGREEWLVSELKKNVNEFDIWEAQAVELYEVLQVSEVIALIFQQKAYELAGKCESLQARYIDQMKNYEINKYLIDREREKMKSKLFALELENEGLRQEVTVDLRLIMSLKDGIIRLEEQALSIKKFHDKEIQIPDLGHDQQSAYQNDHPMKTFELLGYLQEKIDSAGNALLVSKAYFEEESAKATGQLETAMMEMEVLKGRINMMQGEVGSSINARLLKDEGDTSHIRMKDIQLDQVSDRSSPRLASDVYAGPIHQIEEVEPFRFEKSLAVDKIESSRFSGGTQEGSKRILEKLEMDAEKLTNIQASVFDTQNRIKRVEKDKLTSFEHDSFMAHLREIEGAISKLIDMKGKLLKNADEESLGSGRRNRRASERGLYNRRQASEQVRRWSEKIARMELEVQQIRFLLFKLEEEYEMKKKKTMERRVQLRDYLYGGTHDTYKQKKRHLCACMEPMTKED